MSYYTFKGGIHPPENKDTTKGIAIEKATEPATVMIPLQQHIGSPCEPIVKVGDSVRVGQKIGRAEGFVCVPVHASISGTVKAIKEVPLNTGVEGMAVVIESDGKNEKDPSVESKGDLDKITSEEIIEMIKEAGIVGMGGATFPSHVKLSPPPEDKIDTIILNGAECEPYLSADHRLMLEGADDIVLGLKIIMKAAGVENAYIGIENNKPDAIDTMLKAVENEDNIKIAILETKYPQGGEKQLINAITKREVPSGGLPKDIGVIVFNVGTSAQIAKTFRTGMPLIERVITVGGNGVRKPKNLLAKIGTPIKDLIQHCDGYADDVGKIILGGPMMGIAQHTDEVAVVKGTSGLLVFDKKEATIPEPSNCIRCGRCIEVCPINLQPLFISENSLNNRFEEAERYRALDCIECGSCSYICPAKRPLLPSIKVAKDQIIARHSRKNKSN